jgi:hypothetical protein
MCAQKLRTSEPQAILMDVQEMPRDMKRMLRVQLKELIHTLEDRELQDRFQHGGFSGPQAA